MTTQWSHPGIGRCIDVFGAFGIDERRAAEARMSCRPDASTQIALSVLKRSSLCDRPGRFVG
jgi:hypothetical protein